MAKAKAKSTRAKARSKARTKAKARTTARATTKARAKARTTARTFSVLVVVSENDVIRDVREAIRSEVAKGGEWNSRWVPAKPPMSLNKGQWTAVGGAIVGRVRKTYQGLVVKRQEIEAHHTKELTAFRKFLTDRITKNK